MSWRLAARKDVADSIRQYHLHAGVLLCVLLFAGTAFVTTQTFGGSRVAPAAVPGALAMLATFLVPLLAVGFSQGVVVGMRERGDLKLFLGLPFSRSDLVLGSFAGRTVFVWTSLLSGIVVGALLALGRGAPVAFDLLLVATGLLGVLGAIFVAIAVGISASVSTETRSGALGIGAFFLFVFQLWSAVPHVILWVINGFGPAREIPTWVPFLTNLNPVLATWNVLGRLLPGGGGFIGSVSAAPPVYQTVPFALVVLAGWLLLPLAVGLRRFNGTDL